MDLMRKTVVSTTLEARPVSDGTIYGIIKKQTHTLKHTHYGTVYIETNKQTHI